MPSFGFNFRATSGGISPLTDGANETYVLLSDTTPTTRNGSPLFNWDTSLSVDSRDRLTTGEASLAGINFVGNSAGEAFFKVVLPSAVDLTIRAAFGDGTGTQTQYVRFKEGTTTFATVSAVGTNANEFVDAGGTLRTSQANWIIDNASIARTFSSTDFRVYIGDPAVSGGNTTTIAHLYIEWPDAGIAFDAAGNSGDIAAASSYSGSAAWAGADRMLSVDVAMLGPGVTVSAMTYGGAACTFIGAQTSVTSFGRIEQWRICSSDSGAPAAGSNTLAVTLTGSLEFAVGWVSRTGVHQSLPVEAFNGAQATNTGTADNASVTITSTADNCVIHSATVANDTSISAGQTSRNNVSGTLGSGLDEDSGATPVTPAGATSMTATGMGITTTWAIAGYAVRPLAASGAATKAPAAMLNLLLGAH